MHLTGQEFSLLTSAVNDAIAMEAVLREKHGFETVAMLLNEDATKRNIERALDIVHRRFQERQPEPSAEKPADLLRGTADDDWARLQLAVHTAGRVLVFFAGHGITTSSWSLRPAMPSASSDTGQAGGTAPGDGWAPTPHQRWANPNSRSPARASLSASLGFSGAEKTAKVVGTETSVASPTRVRAGSAVEASVSAASGTIGIGHDASTWTSVEPRGEHLYDSYLCPFDADKARVVSTCINIGTIALFARVCVAKQQLYVFDCCHAGSLLTQSRGGAQWGVHLSQRPAVVGMTAVSEGEEAVEAHGRGVFSKVPGKLLGRSGRVACIELVDVLQ